jgi:DNA-directed RNA polymerase specialized sigma24 family protein
MEVEVRKRKKKTSNVYFTKDTEDAIVAYNYSTDFEERNKIYNEQIHYAFFKLTENIIHTFKFYYTEVDNIEDLQHEVITFLLSKIHLFDQSKGAKAFSYFGTIAKRYLILSNQKNYKKRVETSPVASIEEDEKFSYQLDDTKSVVESNLSKFMDEYIEYCTDNIFELFPKETDAQVADAILEVFRKRDSLDVFNKKALYIYIREMIDVKTPKITKIADQLYDIFKKKYVFYLEHGYTNF